MSTFTWPTFVKEPLDGGRTWSATFDSYDQYHEDCYYLITLLHGVLADAPFMAQIGMEFSGDNWNRPEFHAELKRRIAEVAATGKTNTTHVAYAR